MQSLDRLSHRTKSNENLLYQFAQESTVHGIREIITSPNYRFKAFWIVITLGCTCLCFYQIVIALRQYTERPTSVIAEIASLRELPLTAICPIKWLDSANAKQLGLTLDALYYLWTMVPWVAEDAFVGYGTGAVSNFSNNLNPEEGMGIVKNVLMAKNLSIYELIYRASVNITAFACEYCADGYPVKVMTPAGICFVAKFTNAAISQPPWVWYSVPPAAIGFDRLYGQHSDYSAQSIYGSDIGNSYRYESFGLYPGDVLKYKFLFQVFTRQRGSGFADIESDDNHFQCREDCMQRITSIEYGVNCSWLGFGRISERLTKNVSNPCAYDHWPYFLERMVDMYPFASRMSSCLTNCQQARRIIMTTSTATIDPMKNYGERNEFTAYTSVNYNFQAAANTFHIEEVPAYTWDTFIANLGGILGLWLGASIMSVFQLLYFCTLAILNRAKSRRSGVADDTIRVNESPV